MTTIKPSFSSKTYKHKILKIDWNTRKVVLAENLVANAQTLPKNSSVNNVLNFVFQAKAVLKFIEAISEKTLRTTVALTAARGRGKSAALGLAMAAAIAFG